jgi:malonate-semialdehyde dehydrogenase (acetylating)/methylmalonate-semialdehyde dehydrogenase
MKTIEHWIDGAPSTGAGGDTPRYTPVWNPATGEQQARVLLATTADVDRAVASARKAADSWAQASLSRRGKVMFALRDLLERYETDLARIVTAEHGKVLDDARGEIVRGREVVEFACGIAHLLKGGYSDQVSTDIDSYSFRQPLGVVAGITPFNFPVMVPLWMHPVAIACGNAFVLKPSERDPSAALFVAQLYADAGLPDGVFSVVQGDKVAVDAILDHPDIDAVSFVGSTPIARYVHQRASQAGKRVQALGGAKNHAVVLPDADLDYAADQLTAAAYGSAGQRCMAVSAVVAVGAAGDGLVDRLKQRAAAIRVGPGDDARSGMGPVVSPEAEQRIRAATQGGVDAGATLVVDGRGVTVDGYPDGFYLGPSLFDRVTAEMDVYREEIFGPVLVVLRADTAQQAIELVNANPYGNGTALFTASGEAARQFQREVTVGMIGINVPIPVPMAYYSFGGWKASLFGDTHVHGPEGVAFYTRAKVVTARWPGTGASQDAQLHFPTAH